MASVRVIDTASTYWRHARVLSHYWDRSLSITVVKLVVSRLVYHRGPQEFDQFRFINKPLRQWAEYTTERELNALQDPLAPAAYRHLDDDKLAFAEQCNRHGLRTAPILAVIPSRAGTRVAFGNVATARSGDDLARIFAQHGDFDGFAKPLDAGQGYGAFGFSWRSGTVVAPATMRTARELFEHCATSAYAPGGYLLQPRIVPHPALYPFMSGPGLGTARLLTFLHENGDVVIPSAWLKLPAPGAECDNLRTGSLVAAIDVESGALHQAVGATAPRPVVHGMDTHPVTGARIAGTVVPCWAEVTALVTRAARAFAVLPVLGWDVAIAPDGPLLIEANVNFAALERASDHGQAAALRQLFAQVARSRRAPDDAALRR